MLGETEGDLRCAQEDKGLLGGGGSRREREGRRDALQTAQPTNHGGCGCGCGG